MRKTSSSADGREKRFGARCALVGGVVVIFGRGRTHMTRIPTGAQGFGKCYAHMLRTHTQPERAQITFFSTLSAIRLRGSDASIDAT